MRDWEKQKRVWKKVELLGEKNEDFSGKQISMEKEGQSVNQLSGHNMWFQFVYPSFIFSKSNVHVNSTDNWTE